MIEKGIDSMEVKIIQFEKGVHLYPFHHKKKHNVCIFINNNIILNLILLLI